MKTRRKILGVVLSIFMLISCSFTAYATSNTTNSDNDDGGLSKSRAAKEVESTGPLLGEHNVTILDISKTLSNTQMRALRAGEDVSGTFESKRENLNTPGVEWYYEVDYIISANKNNDGWYFKSVDCTVHVNSNALFDLWAKSGSLEIIDPTYTLSPSPEPTKVTIKAEVEITARPDNNYPEVTYTEYCSGSTTISNIVDTD